MTAVKRPSDITSSMLPAEALKHLQVSVDSSVFISTENMSYESARCLRLSSLGLQPPFAMTSSLASWRVSWGFWLIRASTSALIFSFRLLVSDTSSSIAVTQTPAKAYSCCMRVFSSV